MPQLKLKVCGRRYDSSDEPHTGLGWLEMTPLKRTPCGRWGLSRQVGLVIAENKDMNIEAKFAGLEVGYDVPAIPGMSEDEIQTPCLILDLDALERNIRKMGDHARAHNMRHRAREDAQIC